jgi:pyruvate,water dikinase
VWCRGNVGEVFPNVVTPMSNSVYLRAVARGQAAAAVAMGMVTRAQHEMFRDDEPWSTGIFGGYLYGNVTLARTAVARTPGLSVEMIDEQMFGLSDAPPHRRQPGERDVASTLRAGLGLLSALWRVDRSTLVGDQDDIAAYVAAQPVIEAASDAQLIEVVTGMRTWAERMMHHLLLTSGRAGFSRAALEGVVAPLGEPGLENRLTAGLGTVESAEPAQHLWRLGRLVAGSDPLTHAFDDGVADLDARLRSMEHGDATAFLDEFDAFRAAHGSRGPNEWELASPTWGSEPAIALAMIERLRHAPEDRDPAVVGRRLAAERERLIADTRRRLPRLRRPLFDRAVRAAMAYAPMREATKAAYVRALEPARSALAELAHRSGLPRDDFFLLTVDEVADAVGGTPPPAGEMADRRMRRDHLQARVPPFWFEGVIPAPHTWVVRAAGRRPDGTARTITGMGVCSGEATGTARVITDPTDPGQLTPGDILVAPITDPAWTPLLLAAAGVVVDVGAQQSHAAIVSRELGIPTVVSATEASSTIPDGATVTVNGSTGVVTVHP